MTTKRPGPWPSAPRRHTASACGLVVRAGIPLVILAAPIRFGAVGQAAVTSLLALAVLVAAALLAERALSGGGKPLLLGAPGILGLIFVGLILVRIVPVPQGLLSLVSPAADSHYAATIPGYGGKADAILSLERTTLPASALDPPPAVPMMRTISLDPHATLAALPRTLLCLLLFLLVASAAAGGTRLRLVVVSLVLASTFQAGYGMLEYLSGNQHIFAYEKTFDTDSVTGTYINRNHFAGLIELGLPAGLGLALSLRREVAAGRRSPRQVLIDLGGRRGAQIILIVLACSIMTAGLLLSFSRAGILAGLLGSMLAVVLGRRRVASRSRALILFLVIASAAVPVYIAGSARLLERYRAIPSDIDTAGRLPVWKQTLALAGEFPLTGTGHGTFATVFPARRPPGTGFYDHAHNDYLQLLAEDGLPGFLLVMIALGACLLSVSRARGERPADQLDLSAGLLAGMAAWMAHGLVDFNGQIPANAALFACAAGTIYGWSARPGSRHGPARSIAAAAVLAAIAILAGLTWHLHGRDAAALRSIRAGLDVQETRSPETIARVLARLEEPARRRFPDPEALALLGRYKLLDGQSRAGAEPESPVARARIHEAYRAARRAMIRQPTEAEHFLLAALAFQSAEVFGHLLPGQQAGSPWTEALVGHLLSRASRLDPRNPTRRYSIGTLYIARGRIDEGVEEYRASLEAGRDHSPEILAAVWDLPGGASLIERVSPTTRRARLDLARFHARAGRPRLAETLFEEILEDPDRGTAREAAAGLARILLAEGRLKEADAVCESAARRFPEERDRLSFLRGLIALQDGRPSEAVDYLESALRVSPASPSVQWHLAEALCGVDDSRACIARMDRLLSGGGLSARRELSARIHLARALERVGRLEESLEQYLRARAVDPDSSEASEGIRRLDRFR